MSNKVGTNVNVFKCKSECCNFYYTDYKDIVYSWDDGWKETDGMFKKAGCFIYDPTTNRILLVQSRAFKWGCPKGSVQDQELPKDCAIREVREETGLTVKEMHLPQTDTNEQIKHIQSIAEDAEHPYIERNDVNGIGWIRVDCLKDMMINKKILINQNTKQLLRKFLDKLI